ncbi:MAG: VWA domain-containing protein [Acidobacteria bacterium]|nr:VWA domain-containing protein [Acidobacteriota bacterium]
MKKSERKLSAGLFLSHARRLPALLLFLFFLTPCALGQTEEEPVGETITIDTGLVDLNVSVFSRDAKVSVGELQQKDFLVLENGQQEEISFFAASSTPFDLVLLLDLSGSTADKLDLIRKSAKRFVEAARPTDRIGIVTFTNAPQVISPLTEDRKTLLERIKKIEKPRGGTNFWDALYFVLKGVLKNAQRRSAVIVMTDGVDNALPGVAGEGSSVSFEELLEVVRGSDAIVLPIYLDTEREMLKQRLATELSFLYARRELAQLAMESGSIVYQARKLEDLKGVYEQVIRDLGTVYSIGYRPKNTERNGSWRNVTVQLVGRPDLSARTKRGYYAK